MYNITQEEIEEIIYHFSCLFEYDYYSSTYVSEEGTEIVIGFYNSPIRRSFGVSISYDENTYIETISDAIINAYFKRLY